MSRTVSTINPATGESLKTYDAAGLDDVLAILEAVYPPESPPAAASHRFDRRLVHSHSSNRRMLRRDRAISSALVVEDGLRISACAVCGDAVY